MPGGTDGCGTGPKGSSKLNQTRSQAGLPTTAVYLALHVGDVFYGNVGSKDRLDFTVIGPAVNEVSRILAMSRSVEQDYCCPRASPTPSAPEMRRRLVSVGRYALRGVTQPQELFTPEPDLLTDPAIDLFSGSPTLARL